MGCLFSVVIWLGATAALFWFGSGAPAATVAAVVGGAVVACFGAQSIAGFASRARHRGLTAHYIRIFGPLPEEVKVVGTRVGGTIGRLLGGSTGYLIGGLAGAAADLRAEAKKYEQMSASQRALLEEIRRIAPMNPAVMSLLMLGALLVSWMLVVAYEMGRAVFG